MQVEQLTADRCRRIAAILHQLVPIAVAQLRGVEPEGAQHVMAMLRGDAGRGQALAHRGGCRRIAGWRAIQDGRQPIEATQLVLGGECRAVGDVVGIAREAVEDVHMDPQIAPDQP